MIAALEKIREGTGRFGGFIEGPRTLDLVDARSLLNDLTPLTTEVFPDN